MPHLLALCSRLKASTAAGQVVHNSRHCTLAHELPLYPLLIALMRSSCKLLVLATLWNRLTALQKLWECHGSSYAVPQDRRL